MATQATTKATPEKDKRSSLKYQRDQDREMVKGIFQFYEVPGGSMSFCFKKYKEDQVERFDFMDGQIYNIPLGVAKHLNKNGWYPVHEYLKNEDGKPSMKIGKKVRRFGFRSLEFTDIEDMTPDGEPFIVEASIIL
jgi:hypothetical protein